ncbi:MAG: replicative DNA helicase [Clostridia bacterium]|nr:replicative DNA helicase [Clostridia bacterium]
MAKEKAVSGKMNLGEMPHSLEAEQALLGCLLLDTRIQIEIVAFLKEEDFYAESHRYIFHAMKDIISRNQPVDLVTLTDTLEKQGALEQAGGIAYITELTNVMPSSANYQRYLDIVTRDGMLRKLIKGSAEIIENSKTSQDKKDALAFAEKTVYDISNEADTSEMVKIGQVIPEVIGKFEELASDKSAKHGIKSKFHGLDLLLNGLHRSDLMIIAARPATGKTSFAMNIVENVALQGYSCAVFSLEMGKEQLVQRMMCSVAGVSMSNASKGKINKTEWLKLAQAREKLNNAKIFIDDSSMITPQQIISKCRRLKSRFGLDLVMVDYIQLMTPDKTRSSDSRQNEITEISRYLKILAKEVNVPVLALSQLSREVEKRKGRPQLSDLRESGAIEQDADIVMFIHRPDKNATEKEIAEGKVQQNVAEILVEKHRNGPTGMVKLYFKGECTKFINLNEETGEPDDESENQSHSVASKAVKEYEDLPETNVKTEESLAVKSVDDEIF